MPSLYLHANSLSSHLPAPNTYFYLSSLHLHAMASSPHEHAAHNCFSRACTCTRLPQVLLSSLHLHAKFSSPHVHPPQIESVHPAPMYYCMVLALDLSVFIKVRLCALHALEFHGAVLCGVMFCVAACYIHNRFLFSCSRTSSLNLHACRRLAAV